jgi:hypothetical protein
MDVFLIKQPSIYQQDEVLRNELWAVNETWVLPNDRRLSDRCQERNWLHLQISLRGSGDCDLAYCAKGGDFLCVEPWWGIGTYQGHAERNESQRRDENVIEKSEELPL